MRRGNTKRNAWCRARIPTSWMSSVQDATRSPRCSATPRWWFRASDARPSCASRREAKPGLPKVVRLGESSTECGSLLPRATLPLSLASSRRLLWPARNPSSARVDPLACVQISPSPSSEPRGH